MNVPYPPPRRKPYTAEQVRAFFQAEGIAISAWAEANGYDRHSVYCVLGGQFKGNRGKAHAIALKLGLKLSAAQLVA
ncbi:hypothetical protein D3C76_578180 [compost metagenome]